jgi:hypothetical protein
MGDVKIFRLFTEDLLCDVSNLLYNGTDVLFYSISLGKNDIAHYILENYPMNVQKIYKYEHKKRIWNITILHLSCLLKNYQMIKFLISEV